MKTLELNSNKSKCRLQNITQPPLWSSFTTQWSLVDNGGNSAWPELSETLVRQSAGLNILKVETGQTLKITQLQLHKMGLSINTLTLLLKLYILAESFSDWLLKISIGSSSWHSMHNRGLKVSSGIRTRKLLLKRTSNKRNCCSLLHLVANTDIAVNRHLVCTFTRSIQKHTHTTIPTHALSKFIESSPSPPKSTSLGMRGSQRWEKHAISGKKESSLKLCLCFLLLWSNSTNHSGNRTEKKDFTYT